MFQRDSRALGFHAAVIILLGMIAGFPYGVHILETTTGDIIRAWRTAHLLGLVNGLFLIAVAAMWAKMVNRSKSTSLKTCWENLFNTSMTPMTLS